MSAVDKNQANDALAQGKLAPLSPRSDGSINSGLTKSGSNVSLGFDKYAKEAIPLDFEVPMLGPDHVNEISKANGFDYGDAKRHFDHLSTNYEAIYLRLGFPDPMKVAEKCEKYAKLKGLKKEDAKILDLGCGTGLIGKYLAQKGFRNITGLDVSPHMLEKARNKGVYKDLVEHDLFDTDNFPGHLKDTFDIVCASGLINNNHMDESLFEDMMRSAKKDALIIFAAKLSYIGEYWYDSVLDKFKTESRMRLLEKEDFFKYDRIISSIGRFSRTPSRVFVFENLMDANTAQIRKTILKRMYNSFYEKFINVAKKKK